MLELGILKVAILSQVICFLKLVFRKDLCILSCIFPILGEAAVTSSVRVPQGKKQTQEESNSLLTLCRTRLSACVMTVLQSLLLR